MAIKSNRAAVSQKLRSEIDKRLEQSGIVVTNQAKLFSPVDTGRLRSSLTYEKDGNTVQIGTNVNYAWYVEGGTRHAAAQPYLVPGMNSARPALIAMWSKPINE